MGDDHRSPVQPPNIALSSLSDASWHRWLGTSAGASDPYPDFTGVNNADRMKIAVEMAGGQHRSRLDLTGLAPKAHRLPRDRSFWCPAVHRRSRANAGQRRILRRWRGDLAADGRKVAIVGTAADRDAANAVIAEAPACIDLVGKTDIASLTSLFAGAHAVIGNDTGPVFLAAKTGTPTLMVMGRDTDPEMSAPTGGKTAWVRQDRIEKMCPKSLLSRPCDG